MRVEPKTYQDDLEQHLLVDLHELLVPLLNVGSLLAGVGVIILGSGGVKFVLLAPLENLLEDGFVDVGNGDGFSGSAFAHIFDEILDQD